MQMLVADTREQESCQPFDPLCPFSSFTRTDHRVSFSTGDQTQTVMCEPTDVVTGATVRVRGPLRQRNRVDALTVVVLTNGATVQYGPRGGRAASSAALRRRRSPS